MSEVEQARERIVKAALALDRCACEFDGEFSLCSEYLDSLWSACDEYRRVAAMEPGLEMPEPPVS